MYKRRIIVFLVIVGLVLVGLAGRLGYLQFLQADVYLKDADDVYWSLSWQPTAHTPDDYECRVGMGYQTIRMLHRDVRSEVTYFVPVEDNLEIWLVRVKNERLREERSLKVLVKPNQVHSLEVNFLKKQ